MLERGALVDARRPHVEQNQERTNSTVSWGDVSMLFVAAAPPAGVYKRRLGTLRPVVLPAAD